jgi:putative phosphoribosyl transferase
VATFVDRRDAGRRLAAAVRDRSRRSGRRIGVVLGLPRGGVVVAAEVAAVLAVPLDVVVVRKVGAPGRPELGLGAVAEEGVCVVNEALVDHLDVDQESLDAVTALELERARRNVEVFCGGRDRVALSGADVLLVDDGSATGYTALAAVDAVRRRGAASVTVGLPVSSQPAQALLEEVADEIVTLRVQTRFVSVGEAYEEFDQCTDEQVLAALEGAAARQSERDADAAAPRDGTGRLRTRARSIRR